MVPLRVIGSSDADFVSSIIVGTNKQNQVREDQFWALLPFMKDLEIYCAAQDSDAKILIERRDNQYRDASIERTRIMRPSDLMKACAAMFFYQPHRAARDHRGIRKEYSDRIFLDRHPVELYHVAAVAMYKFDYLVRTGKIDRTWSIYKFYILFSLVRELWESPNLLDAPKKSRDKVWRSLTEVIMNTDKFLLHVNNVSVFIDDMVRASGTKTREQVRDYIRTDTFSEQFASSYFRNTAIAGTS